MATITRKTKTLPFLHKKNKINSIFSMYSVCFSLVLSFTVAVIVGVIVIIGALLSFSVVNRIVWFALRRKERERRAGA